MFLIIARLHDVEHGDRNTTHKPTNLFKNVCHVVSNTVVSRSFSLEQKVPVKKHFSVLSVCCVTFGYLLKRVSFDPFEKIQVFRIIYDTKKCILELNKRFSQKEFLTFCKIFDSFRGIFTINKKLNQWYRFILHQIGLDLFKL